MNLKKLVIAVLVCLFFLGASIVYLYPLKDGLILLPLDLLVSNYNPWSISNQILLKNPYMQDSIVQLYPWKHLAISSVLNFTIPFWNPYQHMGMPFMASMKPMVFYPLNIVGVFGEKMGWNILLLLQLFLAMVFSYILARSFKLNFFASVLVSFAYSLNSLMIGFLQFGSDGQVLLWIPLFIYSAKRYIEKKQGIYLFLLGSSIACSILAGQLQYTAYSFIILAAFILFYGISHKAKKSTYVYLGLATALGIGLCSIQLLPSIELFGLSYRGLSGSYDAFSRGLIQPYHALRLFAPDFFGNPVTRDATIGYIESSGYFGVIPLFFAGYAVVFLRKSGLIKFLGIMLLVGLLLSMNFIGPILYALKIPVITSGAGGRIFFFVYFAGALLAGFGMADFLDLKRKRKGLLYVLSFIACFIVAVAAGYFMLSNEFGREVFIRNIKFPFMVFGIFAIGSLSYIFLNKKIKYAPILFGLFIISLTFFDLFRMGYRFLTFSNEKFLYPQTQVVEFVNMGSQKDLSRNTGMTEPEIATYLKTYTLDTYNPLYLQRSGAVLNALQGKELNVFPENKYIVGAMDPSTKRAYDFLGVRYFVTDKGENPAVKFYNSSVHQDKFTKVYEDEEHDVYENLDARKRFGLIYKTEVASDSKALSLLSNNNVADNLVLLDKELPMRLSGGTGSAQLISSDLNSQVFAVKTNAPALLYVSDTYYPGWKAVVNDNDSEVLRANYNFRAVQVPAGESRVAFSYTPTNFMAGVFLSILSGVMLIFLCISDVIRKLAMKK